MLELEPTGQSGRTATGSAKTGGAHIVLLPSGRHVVVTIFSLFLILFVCRQHAHAGIKLCTNVILQFLTGSAG